MDPSDQLIGAYSGFNASVNERQEKNKAYYHFTHAQPPNKTVVDEMMRRCVEAADLKEMPFIQLVGDQPVYALILELKNENPEKYKNILPVKGGFHVQGTLMSTINKRFKGAGIFQLVHASDLLEEGSTDQALRGAHHNRGIRCYMLLYEALIRLLLQTTDIALPPKFKDELFTIKDVKGKTKEDRKLALDSILNDQEFDSFVKNITTEILLHSSEMLQYWLSFLEWWKSY